MTVLIYMATWQAGMFQMPDVQEAHDAGHKKRLPEYAPLHKKKFSM